MIRFVVNFLSFGVVWVLLTGLPATASTTVSGTPYRYFRVGSSADLVAKPKAGNALMGGGTDLDEAFRWLCDRAQGGDFLILRAAGDDAYNPYLQKVCRLNSVATLIVPSREAANNPFVAEAITHAEAIFIAGGDQANYIRFWTGTSVQSGINAAIKRGVPLGGASAGLAVMGEWAYSAEGDKPDDPNLDSRNALMDPLGSRVTLVHGFLDIPVLKGVITDSHFGKRDRMGRLLVFLARIQARSGNESVHGLGIDEKTAVLLDEDGSSRTVGVGKVYLISPIGMVQKLINGKPLDGARFAVQEIDPGGEFSAMTFCCGSGTKRYVVEDGLVRTHQDLEPVK